MMGCKRHPGDLSSTVGVCASCLRDRLFAVMAAQAQAQAQQDTQHPTPLSFPRSVSPYISRRKSDTNAATWQLHAHHRRFYSTPLVCPAAEAKENRKNSAGGRFRFSSLFSGIFRSKSSNPDPGPPAESCSASPSWFSSIVPRRRKKGTQVERRARRNRDRGMSPARYSDEVDVDEHCHGGSSGYSSESSQGWRRRTPATAQRGGGRGSGHSRNVSGLAVCLSPLVRASPNRHWNQKGLPPDMVVGGESRVPAKAHLSAASSFCKNRSRKLADFGRYNNNY